MKITCTLCACLLYLATHAQVTDNFEDSNFTSNPAWTGTDSAWRINGSQQLQSSYATTNSSFYLSTPSTLALAAEWRLLVQLKFNTSSANYIDIFLTSDSANLLAGNNTGYFVRIGGTQDEISLYRRNYNNSNTLLIDGADGITNKSNNTLALRIIRTTTSQWSLYADASGYGLTYALQGTATDSTFTQSTALGFLVRQSTASFFSKHLFSNISLIPYIPDTTAPGLQSATALTPYTLRLSFSEPVDTTKASNPGHYLLNNNTHPATTQPDGTAAMLLTFPSPFPNGITQTIGIDSLTDLSHNTAIQLQNNFAYYQAQPYDILIHEIMADPTPAVQLPDAEYIELLNKSRFPISLKQWTITLNTHHCTLPDITLQPDSLLILCSSTDAPSLQTWGPATGISGFPTIPNTSGKLSLRTPQGTIIHAIAYDDSWYNNTTKAKGGWSLEMIDPTHPCLQSTNWTVSQATTGGTPGHPNSITGTKTDTVSPQLINAALLDSIHVLLHFSLPMDSTSMANPIIYNIDPAIGHPDSAITIAPLFNEVTLHLPAPLTRNTIYTISCQDVTSCNQQTIHVPQTATLGFTSPCDSFDVVINEVLFNPAPGEEDYIELFNRSNKLIDVSTLRIANRNSSGHLAAIKNITDSPRLLQPNDYLLLSEAPATACLHYGCANNKAALKVEALPAYPNENGTVVLLRQDTTIVDELTYTSQWQSPLLASTEGVSLERMLPGNPTQLASNWHSAAGSSGYGTPTYQNSQYQQTSFTNNAVTLSPNPFSPDNDGRDDELLINYRFEQAGFLATIIAFDANGRPVRSIATNTLCGLAGTFRWDGQNDRHAPLPPGIYVILTTIFNQTGKTHQFKQAVVLIKKPQ